MYNYWILLKYFREEYPFYQIKIEVFDSKCQDGDLVNSFTCDEGELTLPEGCNCKDVVEIEGGKCTDLLHICDHTCENDVICSYKQKEIQVEVKDINDNGPLFPAAENSVSYIVKAGADKDQQIGGTFNLADADSEKDHTHMGE